MGSEWGRENGGGGLNFVAEAVEVFLGGGDGSGGEEFFEPCVELGVVDAGGVVAKKGKERGGFLWSEGEVEEDDGVGFSLAEIETGAGAAFKAEGIGKVILDLVGGSETGERFSGFVGKIFGELGKDGSGARSQVEERACFCLGHFFVGG